MEDSDSDDNVDDSDDSENSEESDYSNINKDQIFYNKVRFLLNRGQFIIRMNIVTYKEGRMLTLKILNMLEVLEWKRI